MEFRSQYSLLHELPDPCLLAILSCLTEEPRSRFSAALAHSKLHQAAVLALKDAAPSSIEAVLDKQQEVKGMLLYMEQHGQNASSISLERLHYRAQVLSPLSELNGLREISLCPSTGMRSAQGLGDACQLTGLRRLTLWTDSEASDVFRQLTQLKQLTWLEFGTRIRGNTSYPTTGAEWFNCAVSCLSFG
jgi:hypothetical protein